MKPRGIANIVKKIIYLAIIVAVIIGISQVYRKYNYNDFIKSVNKPEKTNFTRDTEIKYSNMDSYKLENVDYNDAMFSQTISVQPNTPYKVTCKVKVENVQNQDNTKVGGAHISINGSTERSDTISGTSDWQEISLLFNSK